MEGFFNGKLGIFRLINNAADYNVFQVWNLGTREPVASGTFTAPTNNSSYRLNNTFGTPNTNGAYFYTTIYTEDGEYEIQIEYQKITNNGKLDLVIDGVTVRSGLDTNGSAANQPDITKGKKLSAGRHTVKILNNGTSGTSNTVTLNWINFIKRRGHENGGLTNALLLGDEINERFNKAFTLGNSTVAYYDNVYYQTSGAANGDYTEGTLFIKGGLYRIDFDYHKATDQAEIDLWFGDVQVLSQLDAYNGSVTENNVQTVYVRLQQGRQDIRQSANGKNGSSSGYGMTVNAIRLERLSD